MPFILFRYLKLTGQPLYRTTYSESIYHIQFSKSTMLFVYMETSKLLSSEKAFSRPRCVTIVEAIHNFIYLFHRRFLPLSPIVCAPFSENAGAAALGLSSCHQIAVSIVIMLIFIVTANGRPINQQLYFSLL